MFDSTVKAATVSGLAASRTTASATRYLHASLQYYIVLSVIM